MSKSTLYFDETCHLKNDKQDVMCIGYTKILQKDYTVFKKEIKSIKVKHKSPTEIKWNKISHSRIAMYKELIDWFFDMPIKFRCVLVKNKRKLTAPNSPIKDFDTFYYNLVYLLLNVSSIDPESSEISVKMDIKDTRGKEKLNQLNANLELKYKNKF